MCTGKCDIYALGVLLTELLVGVPHRSSDDLEWRQRSDEGRIVEEKRRLGREWCDVKRDGDVDWESFFDGVLQKDPELRWDVAKAKLVLTQRRKRRR